ncbi:MAG: protein kinase domain-containing protein [Lentimonas sp.]
MDPKEPSAYSRLYEEAGPRSPEPYPTEEVCPLFHALNRIDVRYSEEIPVSTGGMKEIFRVHDAPTERYVALARPKADVPIEKYDAFLREAHITGRLEHPNIIKLFDMGIDDQQRPFFTMEFKRGLSLRNILTELKAGKSTEKWPQAQRYSIFLRICEAMAYAHSRHVLHLDLKPENIQVGTFGEVQICDWGLGEIQRGDSEEHLTEALLDPDLYGDQLPPTAKGTPGYMAPEQDDPKSIKTVQSDIFALGCMLYELHTLNEPTQRKEEKPNSPAIAAIVRKACARNPANRYKDVETMRQDVYRHVLGFSPTVEQAGFFRECRLFYRRNRLPCLMAICFTTLLFGAGSWFNAKLSQSYRTTTRALDQTKVALSEAQEAKTFATLQQDAAEKARDEAERLLTKYLEEKELSSELLTNQSVNTVSGSLLLLHFLIMDESITLSTVDNALEQINFALRNNPPPTDRLWQMKGYALFLMQRFEESKKYYAMRDVNEGDISAMLPEYAPLVDQTTGLLPVDEFIRLLRSLYERPQDRAPLIEKMVIYDNLKRESIEDEAKIVRTLLELSNEKWTNPIFEYTEESQHLKISGQSLRKLIRPKVPKGGSPYPTRSILRFLNLRSLDISYSQVNRLEFLEGLELHYLDIRHTPVKNLKPLGMMTSLRELVVEPDQFSEAQLEQIPNFIKVIQKPLNRE